MYNIKNSIRNIKRNKSKYIIVGILITIISLLSVISLVITTSADTAIDEQAQVYGKEITIEQDPSYLREQFQGGSSDSSTDTVSIEELTYEDYENYADSEYVESVEYEQFVNITSDDLVSDESAGGMMMSMDGEESSTSYQLDGIDDIENSSYFAEEDNVLVDGTYPTEENQILIPQSLLESSELSIGDEISISLSSMRRPDESSDEDEETTTIDVTVVGTYEEVNSTGFPQSTIYATMQTAANLDSDFSSVQATYILDDYQNADAFEEEVTEKGLNDGYYVNKNEETLEQVVGPLENMKSLLTNFLIVMVLLGGATLVFVNLLILNERKYEIGVLRALGQTKLTTVKSLILEITIVAIIALIIGMVIGLLLAQPTSNMLLEHFNTATQSTDMMQQGGGAPTMTQGSKGQMNSMMGSLSSSVSELNTFINLKAVFYIIAINILLIITSASVALIHILKYQPREILREGK